MGDGNEIEFEFLLMVDYLDAVGGIWSEKHFLGVVPEQVVQVACEDFLKHAFRVEVFTREVPRQWHKVEEFTNGV